VQIKLYELLTSQFVAQAELAIQLLGGGSLTLSDLMLTR
jgi:hypothetical protein